MMLLMIAAVAGIIVSCIVCPQTLPGREEELSLLEAQLRENRALSRQVQAGLENCIEQYKVQQDPSYCYKGLEQILHAIQREYRENFQDRTEGLTAEGEGRVYRKEMFRKTGVQFLSLLAVQRQIALLHS